MDEADIVDQVDSVDTPAIAQRMLPLSIVNYPVFLHYFPEARCPMPDGKPINPDPYLIQTNSVAES